MGHTIELEVHCPKNNLSLGIKTESVTDATDATDATM